MGTTGQPSAGGAETWERGTVDARYFKAKITQVRFADAMTKPPIKDQTRCSLVYKMVFQKPQSVKKNVARQSTPSTFLSRMIRRTLPQVAMPPTISKVPLTVSRSVTKVSELFKCAQLRPQEYALASALLLRWRIHRERREFRFPCRSRNHDL